MDKQQLNQATEYILTSKHVVAVTGAGISTDSGIPTFRGKNGLWEKFDMTRDGSLEGFIRSPASAWKMFLALYSHIKSAVPNPAHYALALLEDYHLLDVVITQNIDGLHTASGQKNVIEIFGNIQSLTCWNCRKKFSFDSLTISPTDLPPYCQCGGILKPDIVLFGESVSSTLLMSAYHAVQSADTLLVIGTSGLVHPVSALLQMARIQNTHVIEVNTEETIITDTITSLFLRGPASQILQDLCQNIESRK